MGHPNMANTNEINTRVELAPAQQPSQAILQVLADTHGPAHGSTRAVSLSAVNVHRETNADMTMTSFPNGVKYGKGLGLTEVVPPLGGTINDRKDGGMDVFDARHNKVAELDKDKVFHVHTKNGDYSETPNGQVMCKMPPSAERSEHQREEAFENQKSNHHNGEVPNSKFEKYGVSRNGSETRFPNGIEYDTKNNRVTVPAEFNGFSEDKHWDNKTHSIQSVGTDGDGKVLYKRDSTGIHVPTADGTLTENQQGQVRFDRPAAAVTRHGAKGLPEMTIHGADLKPEIDCFKSNDPLCGLDLDGKF